MNSKSVEPKIITINVPVVFMAPYIMVLRGATSIFLGPNGTRFAHAISGPKKVSIFRAQKSLNFQGPPLSMPRVMMLYLSKPLSVSAIKTTGTLVVLCTRVLLCGFVVCCCVLWSPCSCVV